jgi:hypothetical protein
MKKIGLIVLPLILVIVAMGFSGCKEEPYAAGLIVVLTEEASASDYVYTPEDFPGIGCIKVERVDLMVSYPNNRVLSLYMDKHDKKSIERAIEVVRQNPNVIQVSANGYGVIA